jgi:hypothetical protein
MQDVDMYMENPSDVLYNFIPENANLYDSIVTPTQSDIPSLNSQVAESFLPSTCQLETLCSLVKKLESEVIELKNNVQSLESVIQTQSQSNLKAAHTSKRKHRLALIGGYQRKIKRIKENEDEDKSEPEQVCSELTDSDFDLIDVKKCPRRDDVIGQALLLLKEQRPKQNLNQWVAETLAYRYGKNKISDNQRFRKVRAFKRCLPSALCLRCNVSKICTSLSLVE